jgi:Na+/phosphate symporter
MICRLLTIFLLVKNYLSHKKKGEEKLEGKSLKKSDSSTVQGIIAESADNISNVVSRTNKIYSTVLRGLEKENSKSLKKSRKGVQKLDEEVEELRDNIFYFIKKLDETSFRGSSFYITILAYLTDMAQSLDFISKKSFKHVNNNHKKLKFNQIKELQEVDETLTNLLNEIEEIFTNQEFEKISTILARKEEIKAQLSEKISKQIERTRTEEESPKNTTLYFNILLETKDLVASIMNLMEEYYTCYNKE